MEDQIIFFGTCPRCGDRGYERLWGSCHCALCNYSPDFDPAEHYIEFPDGVLAQAAMLGLTKRKSKSLALAQEAL